MTFAYPSNLVISYHDNAGYRNSLRQLMSMKPVCPWDTDTLCEIDQESQDEWNCDDTVVGTFLDAVYAHTKDNEQFRKLYVAAAGAMISEDPNIGLAVLFSYDYLCSFHQCLCHFFQHSSQAINALDDLLKVFCK